MTVLTRAGIIAMESQGQSITPEGLEVAPTPQKMADLVEFISTATQ